MISKEQFTNTMQQFQAQTDFDYKCNGMFQQIFSNDWVTGYSNDILYNAIIELLENIFDDKENGWIQYWLYELDFGKKWVPGSITDSDSSIIDISTVEKLYDFLIKEMDENA